MKISPAVWTHLWRAYPTTLPEQGGILGERDGCIVAYHHDTDATRNPTCAAYSPHTVSLNAVIRRWAQEGIRFAGLVHSHPRWQTELSTADWQYVRAVFADRPIGERLYFPLIVAQGVILPFAITKSPEGLTVTQEDLEIHVS